MNTAPLLPKKDDYVVAIHPKIKKKKVEVQVTKVLKASFHGRDSSHVIITGFTQWVPVPADSKPENNQPQAKFKAGDRVRIVSSGINGCGIVVAKISDDSKSNNIYRILLDGKENSELFPDDEENEIILDFRPGDHVVMLVKKLKGKTGIILEKTEEDKESRFLNNLYRIQLDGQELSHLYSNDEFNFSDIKPVESSETEITSIVQKQIDFFSFDPMESLDLTELKKNELLERAISEHHTIMGIEKEEEKLALFKLHHARNAGIYFKCFKALCIHGEFQTSLKSLGVSERVAQTYMQIVTFWNLICDKSKLCSVEGHALSLRWALDVIRDEKKSLKSAAPTPSKELPLFDLQPTEPPPITEGSSVEVIDLKNLQQTDFNSVAEAIDDKAKSLGLTNGKSVLPDLRDRDRALAEKLDPTTVDDRPGAFYSPVYSPGLPLQEKTGSGIEEKAKHASLLAEDPNPDEEETNHEYDDELVLDVVHQIKESEDPDYVIAAGHNQRVSA